jgi:hypothetical protein
VIAFRRSGKAWWDSDCRFDRRLPVFKTFGSQNKKRRLKMNSNRFPKNLPVSVWVLILFWLIPVCLGRIPINMKPYVESDGVVKVAADGTMVVVYPERRVGFPLRFVEITDYSSGLSTRKYNLGMCVLNILLVGLTLAGIVVLVPKLTLQYSIRTLLLLTAGFAALIILHQSTKFSSSKLFIGVYFTPLFAGGIVAFLKLRSYLFGKIGKSE